MKKYVVAAVMLAAFTAPALAADYYVVQDPTTKKCKIETTKPDGQSMVMIGEAPYATKDDAKAAKAASADCAKKDAN